MIRLVLPPPIGAVLLAAASLAACHRPAPQGELDRLDNQLTEGAAVDDPSLRAALHDQIMVDPRLAQGSDAQAVRPAPRPDPHAMPADAVGAPADTSVGQPLRATPPPVADNHGTPATRGALTLGTVAERGDDRPAAACANGVRYASIWALRLPRALPLYPDARVSEAAGTDADGCRLRVVSFASAAAPGRVLDWFYTHATAAGYSATHRVDGGEHSLVGARDQAVYAVYVTARAGGGASVDLVVNGG